MLPIWLSPTQVRLIPISDRFSGHAEKMAQEIEDSCIRVDIDERPMTMQKRVRDAEMEWVPYIVVVGQKEVKSGMLPVRDRTTSEKRIIKLEQLISDIKDLTKGKPFKPLPLPKQLSKRPQFSG
jgi:threonyl-tRNA synthetase